MCVMGWRSAQWEDGDGGHLCVCFSKSEFKHVCWIAYELSSY